MVATIERLWGVGPATAAKLHARGIATVGEIAQLSLRGAPARDLDAALDQIRDRFGPGAIMRTVLVGRPEDPTVPLLPD